LFFQAKLFRNPAFQGPLTLGLLLRKILSAPRPPFHAGAGGFRKEK
jgi:hypothetical protein